MEAIATQKNFELMLEQEGELFLVQWSMRTKHPKLSGFSPFMGTEWMNNTFYHPTYNNDHVVAIWKIKPQQH